MVSRGYPRRCDFCYKDAFYRGGNGYYTDGRWTRAGRDRAAARPAPVLPGQQHLRLAAIRLPGLFEGCAARGGLWLWPERCRRCCSQPQLIERAVEAGLRSLFIGFESLSEQALRSQETGNRRNITATTRGGCIRRLHGLGVMVNASIVFGMDGEDPSIFDRTLESTVRPRPGVRRRSTC